MQLIKNLMISDEMTEFRQSALENHRGLLFLTSEDGRDWYESQAEFSPDTVKIAFNSQNIILGVQRDVSMLWPVELSVAELDGGDVPEGINHYGEWQFVDGKIIPRVYTDEERKARTARQRNALIAGVTPDAIVLQDLLDTGEITEAQNARLTAFKNYRIQLWQVDLLDPVWPPIPA